MAQSNDYADVPVFTGQPAEQHSAGFFQPPAPSAEGILATDQARAVAEVQAALVIAASRPRNELRARDRLLQACQRVNLASGALYQYSRGGTAVSGPSIRLAEAAARAWGNINYGFRELSRRTGESECEAYAWDLETNTKAVRQFSVRHRRDTRKGGYDVTDERDIYELMANHAQRRVRAAILEIIPGDIMEDAVAECEKTMKANVGDVKEAAAKLVHTFSELGVPREALEKRLGHRIDAIQSGQIIAFRKIYASIKDGMSEPKDWFDLAETPQAAPAKTETEQTAPVAEQPARQSETPTKAPEPEQAPQAAPASAVRAQRVTDEDSNGLRNAQSEEPAVAIRKQAEPASGYRKPAEAPAAKEEPKQEKKAAPKPAGKPAAQKAATRLTHDPITGEVYGPAAARPAASLITCPNSGRQVDELDCSSKSCRTGCPVFEF